MKRIYPLFVALLLLSFPVKAKAPNNSIVIVDESTESHIVGGNTLVGLGNIKDPQREPLRIEPNEPKIAINQQIEEMAKKYDVSYRQMRETIKGESGFQHEGVWGDNGKAFGIAQFHQGTFLSFRPRQDMSYYDLEDQLETMAAMFAQGKEWHWTEWCKRFGRDLPACSYIYK